MNIRGININSKETCYCHGHTRARTCVRFGRRSVCDVFTFLRHHYYYYTQRHHIISSTAGVSVLMLHRRNTYAQSVVQAMTRSWTDCCEDSENQYTGSISKTNQGIYQVYIYIVCIYEYVPANERPAHTDTECSTQRDQKKNE